MIHASSKVILRRTSRRLAPCGGGGNLTIQTAATPAPVLHLLELDQIGELLGHVSVPAGTYTAAILTLSANPGDVLPNVAADPEVGFAGAPGAVIPTYGTRYAGLNHPANAGGWSAAATLMDPSSLPLAPAARWDTRSIAPTY